MDLYQGNRRQLLASSAGVAMALVVRPVPSAVKSEDLTFVIVSDTHLGRKDNRTAEKQWRQAINEINQHSAEFVLHLGDIVDGGRAAQYPVYVETRGHLKKPIFEIPGNHDPLDLFHKHVAAETDRVIDRGNVRFLLFNNAHCDSHNGFITAQQLKWLEQQMTDAAAKAMGIMLCCHVPVHSNKHPDRGWYVKPADGQAGFYDLLSRFSDRVIACLHGHFHNGIRGWQDHGTIESLVPSVCYNQDRGLAKHLASGAAQGFFVDELRPGYLLATIREGQFAMRYKPLGEAAIPASLPK